MSTDGLSVVNNARVILGDPDNGAPVFTTPEMRMALNSEQAIMATPDVLGLGSAWSLASITLVPGTLDYTLPGTADYAQVLTVRYSSDSLPLRQRSLEEIETRRSGAIAQGRPTIYALRPTSTGTVVLMVDTDPKSGETLDLLVTTVPARWVATDATAPTIYFSQKGALALELRTAAAMVEAAGPEKLNALALGATDAKAWRAKSGELERLERLAIIRLKRSLGALNSAWFIQWVAQ